MELPAAFFDICNQLGKLVGSFKSLDLSRRRNGQSNSASLRLLSEVP